MKVTLKCGSCNRTFERETTQRWVLNQIGTWFQGIGCPYEHKDGTEVSTQIVKVIE